MENTFFDLDTMSQKNGCIIEKCADLDTTRALAIIDRKMYLVIASAGTTTYFYNSKMHSIYNSVQYHGHNILQLMNNTETWYCPYLHSKGHLSRHKNLDTILSLINNIDK